VDSIWFWPAAVLAVIVSWPLWRGHLARLVARAAGPAPAFVEPPERITLQLIGDPAWRHPQATQLAERQLAAAGFVECGAYVIREMRDLTLGLWAHPAERAYAMVYDHPRSGAWVEFVTRYDDDTLANYTTLEPMDVEVPEGSIHVAAPGLSAGELWQRMLAERPRRPMRACSRAAAAGDFERGYAESVAHHKRTAGAASEAPYDDEDIQKVA
jgi:hypothetical protein